MKRILFITRGSTYYHTKVYYNDKSVEEYDLELKEFLDKYLKIFSSSIEINKNINNQIFGYKKIVPIIVCPQNFIYWAVSGKLEDSNVVVFEMLRSNYIREEKGQSIVDFQVFEICMNCTKYHYEQQYERIKNIYNYYSNSLDNAEQFLINLKKGAVMNE